MPNTPTTGRAATPEAEARRVAKISKAQRGNISAGRHSHRIWLARGRALTDADKRVIRAGRRLAVELTSARGGPETITPQEAVLIGSATRLSIAADLASRELLEGGAFIDGPKGKAESPALRSLPRILAELRMSLATLGLDRRAAPAKSWEDHVAGLIAGTRTPDDTIPAEAVEVRE